MAAPFVAVEPANVGDARLHPTGLLTAEALRSTPMRHRNDKLSNDASTASPGTMSSTSTPECIRCESGLRRTNSAHPSAPTTFESAPPTQPAMSSSSTSDYSLINLLSFLAPPSPRRYPPSIISAPSTIANEPGHAQNRSHTPSICASRETRPLLILPTSRTPREFAKQPLWDPPDGLNIGTGCGRVMIVRREPRPRCLQQRVYTGNQHGDNVDINLGTLTYKVELQFPHVSHTWQSIPIPSPMNTFKSYRDQVVWERLDSTL
ncbi:hypothetical protein CC80DRAFT_500111 [Byssothecium circinans]|uniref:Uncharacterized protein n=1 Tax=Byssothecium circinans TaxID=147558 RepID=A0A6A5UBN9_9PLEO|nr:hypothetical protein CC80DRAFT_500111 [Byssothecium circinans]